MNDLTTDLKQPGTSLTERLAKAQPVIAVEPTLKLQLAKRGVDEYGWNTLKQSIFPGASDASVLMAIDYCKARRLDVLKKPVHIVPIYDKKTRTMVDTVWPSISEIRTTAMRTGQYAGKDETSLGPIKEEQVGKVKHRFPEWAQITVYRLMDGQRIPFVGPKVYWLEAYATAARDDDSPNQMWQERPFGQIDKCAEAAALRAAFPEEIGNDYSVDEARQYGGGFKDVTPKHDRGADLTNRIMGMVPDPEPEAQADPPAEPNMMTLHTADLNQAKGGKPSISHTFPASEPKPTTNYATLGKIVSSPNDIFADMEEAEKERS